MIEHGGVALLKNREEHADLVIIGGGTGGCAAALAADLGLMLTVYHNRRWDGWYLTVKERIQAGVPGDIFMVDMFIGGYKKPGPTWRADKAVSGGLFLVRRERSC
jgi:hypothetical protein